ncbi:hypothetical protein F2Q70_00011418 [Brassica cretica]|uniref:Uncharacterized protein n=2 Tax=Brassica cretica TaxID=69181 RepID=A0A8S9LX50_BRACR|nr:hypothetical protein F2Q68_00004539 [Brassica cretica]KAF2612324.1 hypothetical protein F2Q70_00011418 [Brassica cretica]KAF3547391.1 hypothetical protein DY000_02006659 [Brassica cretica]
MKSGSKAQQTSLPDPALGLDPYDRVRPKPNPEGLTTEPASTDTVWNMHPFGDWYLLVLVHFDVRNPWYLVPFGYLHPLATHNLWQDVTFGNSCLLGHSQPFRPNLPVAGAIRTIRITDQCLERREEKWIEADKENRMGLRTRPKPRCDHMDRLFGLMGPRPITYLLNHVISLSIFTLELENEIDREDPIFIENEGVSIAPRTCMTCSEWATIGQGLHLSATCSQSPKPTWFWVGHKPTTFPKRSGLSPRPCPNSQQPMASWSDLTARH